MSDSQNTKSSGGPDRRDVLRVMTAGICAAQIPVTPLKAAARRPRLKAIAFDALTILDTRPVFDLVAELFRGRGVELSSEWRTRQFEYSWLRTVSGRYVDFWTVTNDALTYAASKTKVNVSAENRSRLMNAYLQLKPWPDVLPVLTALQDARVRMAPLSNFTPTMLISCVETSGLHGIFECLLSTDAVKAFKPDPRTYQMGVNAFQLNREEILFVAHAGWDAAGAKTFGYPTYWANRLNVPPEELGVTVDRTAIDLRDLLSFVGAWNLEA